MSNLQEQIIQHSLDQERPDGTNYTTLLFKDEEHLARKLDISLKSVQIASLEIGITPERYCRNQNTLSLTDQLQLLNSHVVIIGQGGLGGTVTEILSRIGIGSLTLIDGDVFEDSNLNRQLLSTVNCLGKNKAKTGKERVQQINPAIEVTAIDDFLRENNCEILLKNAEIAIDCLDSIPSRLILEQGCRKNNIPLVTAAIGGIAGQITVSLPGRDTIKKIYGNSGRERKKGIETQLGTLPYAAIMIGAMECAEVVQLILTKQSKLMDHILLTDLATYSFEKIRLT